MNVFKLSKRRVSFLAVYCLLFLVLCLPSIFPMQTSEEKIDNIEENTEKARAASAASIFGNNAMIAALSLIPCFGWGFLGLIMFNTGLIAASYPAPYILIFMNPFMYVELGVYAAMIVYSFDAYKLLRVKDWRGAWNCFKRGLALMSVVLLISAIVELLFIWR